MRISTPTIAAVLALALAPAARALTVTVPTDCPTIAAAIASGADVIKVNQGEYHEDVTIPRALELRAGDQAFASVPPPFPTLDGTLTLDQPLSEPGLTITVTGFRITGLVTLASPYGRNAVLRDCRLEAGLTGPPGTRGGLSLRGCTVLGSVDVDPDYFDVTGTTILGGGITGNYESSAVVRWNYIVGPADAAVSIVADEGEASITHNVVIGTTDGIVTIKAVGDTRVTYNEVRRVGRHAFRSLSAGGVSSAGFLHNVADHPAGDGFNVDDCGPIAHNVVLHPGGTGIAGTRYVFGVVGNTVDSAGADGIRVVPPPGGIAEVTACDSNLVLYAQGAGIRLDCAGPARFNVVGRCGDAGVAIQAPTRSLTVSNNTSYLNAGGGFTLAGDAGTSVARNIAFGNQGHGLLWTGSGTPARDCNDWFGNLAGGVGGTTPGATDLAVNPLFCNLPGDDVQLSATSPLVGTACGLIGAMGVGCSTPVAVSEPPAGALGFSAGVRPSPGRVTFRWQATEQPGLLEVFDAGGARVWRRVITAGETGARWGDGPSAPAAPGIYFARLRCGAQEERQRVVILR